MLDGSSRQLLMIFNNWLKAYYQMIQKEKQTLAKTSEIRIRKHRFEDIGRIAELLSELAGSKLGFRDAKNRLALIRKSGETLILASTGKSVVGLLTFRIRHNIESKSHYGEISTVIVDKKWRKKGVGKLLIDAGEDIARKRKCLGLWLVSGFKREKKAHKFYRRQGFDCTGMRFVKRFE